MTPLLSVLLTIVAIALVATLWRLASRRQSLPCPFWLRWLVELDNPFTKTNRAKFIAQPGVRHVFRETKSAMFGR